MTRLSEARFAELVKACGACGATAFEIRAYLDRKLAVMLGSPDDDGRWAHDGEGFVAGTYRIACTACGAIAFDDASCPRCDEGGGLARALAAPARLAPPKRCPTCKATELMILGLAPAQVAYRGDRVTPEPLAELGDPGWHVVAIVCDECGPIAQAPDGCALCGSQIGT
jgi:hypothetical protein